MEAVNLIQQEYDCSSFHIMNKKTHTELINTVKQALQDKDQRIKELKDKLNETHNTIAMQNSELADLYVYENKCNAIEEELNKTYKNSGRDINIVNEDKLFAIKTILKEK